MRLVVPVSGSDPKTRLSAVLTADERREFTEAMLADVLRAVDAAGHSPEVIATAPVACDAPLTVDDRGLDPLVNDLLAETDGELAVGLDEQVVDKRVQPPVVDRQRRVTGHRCSGDDCGTVARRVDGP